MVIYLDFDGTLVEHEYPKIGRCNFGCIEVVKRLQDAGHEVILNTYRADCANGTLEKAIDWLCDAWMVSKSRELDLLPIKATDKRINPDSWDWLRMLKDEVMYIDDMALNIPLKRCCMIESFMVDWDELDKEFIEHKIY